MSEFSFRFSRGDEQEQMFDETARNLRNGKALPDKQRTASAKSDF